MEKKKTQSKSKKSLAKKTVAKKAVETEVVAETKKVAESVGDKVETKKIIKNDHSLLKVLLITILVAVVLTWIIPTGQFSNGALTTSSLSRTGINEIFLSIFYGANYYLVQIIFLLFVGVFYGVMAKTRNYQAMIEKVAKMWKGKEKLFVLVNSLIIALMASLLTHPLVTLIYIPMIFDIAKKLKLTKLNTIAMTFGAVLVGMMGSTYGTYGVEYINSYMGTTFASNIGVRFAILALGYIALNAYIIMMEKKNHGTIKMFLPLNFGINIKI